MKIRDLQIIELSILKSLIALFSKYNIRYYILGGTLLGAVRHKGFIPWDDDIDLGLPRPDYEIFLSIANDILPDHLILKNFHSDISYKKYFSKIEDTRHSIITDEGKEIHSWVDIFPLDGMPSNFFSMKIHCFFLLLIRAILQLSNFKNNFDSKRTNRPFHERMLIFCGKNFRFLERIDTFKVNMLLDRHLKAYDYSNSHYIINFMGAYKLKEMFPKSYYGKGTPYTFENIELVGPKNYDAILRQMYGDYMNPPKNKSSHSLRFDK
jgi:lipopolysaccharide cholinephosphotransferase